MISLVVRKCLVRINILRLQLSFLTRAVMRFPDNSRQCVCEPAGGLNLKRPPSRGRPGSRMGCGQENRIACASAAGLRTQSSQNHQPAPQTRRTGSVARSSILRALHGRPAERPAQSCHGGTRAARRPQRPLMMPPQPPPLRAALSPPLRRPGVVEMLGHGRGRVGRGGGSSLPTFGTALATGPRSRKMELHLVGVNPLFGKPSLCAALGL